MKAYVYVSLKRSVLDPQGKTIQSALKKMGYKGLADIRQGKYFEISLNGGLSRSDAENEVARSQKVGGVLIHKTRAIDLPGLRYAWGIVEGKKNESPGLSSWRVPPTVSSSWPDST